MDDVCFPHPVPQSHQIKRHPNHCAQVRYSLYPLEQSRQLRVNRHEADICGWIISPITGEQVRLYGLAALKAKRRTHNRNPNLSRSRLHGMWTHRSMVSVDTTQIASRHIALRNGRTPAHRRIDSGNARQRVIVCNPEPWELAGFHFRGRRT